MNKELLKKVRDHIANENTGFDMGVYVRSCGTVGCIAGWALMLDGHSADEILDMNYVVYEARQALGLDHDIAIDLFFGMWKGAEGMATTRAQAVAKLDEMLA